MGLLYGEQYESSGIYFKIKLIANLFTLVAYTPVVLSIGKTRYYAKVHMYGALILIVLEYISVRLFSSPYILTGVSVCCCLGRIFAMLILVAGYFRVSIVELFPINLIAKIVIPSSIFLWLVQFIYQVHLDLFEIVICGCVYLIFFIGLSWVLKLDYWSIIKSIIIK